MSGPLKLAPARLRALAEFLEGLSQLAETTGWVLPGGTTVEEVSGPVSVYVGRDPQTGEYAVDDRVGG